MDNFTCECPLGRIGSRCEMTLDFDLNENSSSNGELMTSSQGVEPMPIPYFNGDSFLHYNDEEMAKK